MLYMRFFFVFINHIISAEPILMKFGREYWQQGNTPNYNMETYNFYSRGRRYIGDNTKNVDFQVIYRFINVV